MVKKSTKKLDKNHALPSDTTPKISVGILSGDELPYPSPERVEVDKNDEVWGILSKTEMLSPLPKDATEDATEDTPSGRISDGHPKDLPTSPQSPQSPQSPPVFGSMFTDDIELEHKIVEELLGEKSLERKTELDQPIKWAALESIEGFITPQLPLSGEILRKFKESAFRMLISHRRQGRAEYIDSIAALRGGANGGNFGSSGGTLPSGVGEPSTRRLRRR